MLRKNIPDDIKLQLWVKSGGRCEFKGCNTPVWRNGLTLSKGNFAEVAHIIGSSKDGPRGREDSEDLQTTYSNLMLLCQRCHKEIDDHPDNYPSELLTRWKQEHENRIEIQTSYPEDIHKSTVLMCSINIGDRITPINIEVVRNAMFPKYPSDFKGIKIEEKEFDRFGTETEWQYFAENKIKKKLKKHFEEGIDEDGIKHLSVFGIAPMPLLIFLGKCIGDTVPCDIYQSHRNIENTNKTWHWQESIPQDTRFLTTCQKEGSSNTVILKLAISDTLNEDKYSSLLDSDVSIYQISVEEPSPHFLRNKRQLEIFSYEYRKLLNTIQAKHGSKCEILILPAIPVSIAIECGRVILPTKDPEIFVCEYYKDDGGYKKVLKIN
ncbi:MAG: HNH endonuclease [Raineya sp.]|jgi:hypothetical protein|nr:HNH endonuclease [Raineya sp.]